jgi:hypothetical protein
MADQPPVRLRAAKRLAGHASERRAAEGKHGPVNLVTHVKPPQSAIDYNVGLLLPRRRGELGQAGQAGSAITADFPEVLAALAKQAEG